MSSYFEWTKDLVTGIAVIDSDHKVWIGLANRLHIAMATGKGNEIVSECLINFEKYSTRHFALEEKLMSSYAYEDYDKHVAQHNKIKSFVKDLIAKDESQVITITIETSDFLKDWILHHILGSDITLGVFLKSKGLH